MYTAIQGIIDFACIALEHTNSSTNNNDYNNSYSATAAHPGPLIQRLLKNTLHTSAKEVGKLYLDRGAWRSNDCRRSVKMKSRGLLLAAEFPPFESKAVQ
jgi:hypothetical protein